MYSCFTYTSVGSKLNAGLNAIKTARLSDV